MKKVTTIVRNLDQLSTYITDQSSLSSNIFNITEFPLEFTIGKNLIKLKGNTNIFEVGTELAINPNNIFFLEENQLEIERML